MDNSVNARTIAKNFAEKGFKITSKWITFSLDNKDSPFIKDLQDIVNSFKIEFKFYRQEHYNDPKFNNGCFETIFHTMVGGMSTGPEKFRELTTKLVPVMRRIIENNRGMDTLLIDTQNLKPNEEFHRYCHYYQMLWEGDYKLVRKNLLAMKRLREGKNIAITETLALAIGKKIESTTSLAEVTPERLKTGDHVHLRNAIAHFHFRFIGEEGKMEFWDIDPRTQKYSWGPKKYTLEEFSKPLLEINLFCEAFGLLVLLLMALTDLSNCKHDFNKS
jgi:hypothetical protein